MEQYFLTHEERQFYDDHGYIIIKGLIDLDTIATLRKRINDVCNNAPKGMIVVVKDWDLVNKKRTIEETVNKINFLNFDPVFSQYHEHPRLLHAVSQLIGENISLINSMVINKPPGSKWHPPHQDGFYVPMRPLDKIVTAWTAIDSVSETNGSLFVIPGSHKTNVMHPEVCLPNFKNQMFFTISDVDVVAPVSKRLSLTPMEPGDTVIFHSLTVHGSWANTSNLFRKAITALYSSQECEYIDVKGSLQETFEIEINNELKRTHGSDLQHLTFEEFTEARIKRLGRGLKSNL